MVSAVAYQVYVNYLFNIVEGTLKIKNYIIPVGIIMVVAAIGSVIISALMDKYGKKHFYYPTIIAGIVGCIIIWCAKFFVDKDETAEVAILIVGGILVIGVALLWQDFLLLLTEIIFQKEKRACSKDAEW